MEQYKLDIQYILFTSTNFPTGGPGATYLNSFCKGVKENGVEIKVYLFKGYIYKGFKKNKNKKNITAYGVPYKSLGFINRSHNKVLKILENLISLFKTSLLMLKFIPHRKKITVFVYSNDFFSNTPVYLFSKIFRIRLVSFVPEFYDKEELKKLGWIHLIKWYLFFMNYNFLNKLSDKLVVFSTFLKNEYINKGYDNRKVILQPNLTDLNGWFIPDQTTKYNIGYAGTPSKKDGLFDLITSIKLLKDKRIIMKVIIIGDSTGPHSCLPALRAFCKKLDVLDQITFTGLVSQKEVKKYLNNCQILAITRPNTKTTQAGFPTKLGEYMACKKVVLATRFGDIEKYFTDKIEIVLANTDDPDSITENILWILNNPEKSEIIAKKGFEKANEILNYHIGVRKIINSLY
jgi:glycosyltransferase involved in cell wall biosynthesis